MKCAYLIVLMATYWMTEAMPLPITSMIPMVTIRILIECCILNQVGLPLLGLMSTGEVAVNYLNATNYMVSKSISFDLIRHSLTLRSVSWWLDHGNCGGALRPPQQGGLEDHNDGGDVAGEADARVHVHHHVPLHVDLQHRHHSHDASNRFI